MCENIMHVVLYKIALSAILWNHIILSIIFISMGNKIEGFCILSKNDGEK